MKTESKENSSVKEKLNTYKSGIAHRWIYNTVVSVAVVMVVFIIFFLILVSNFYSAAARTELESQYSNSVNSFFTNYINTANGSFEDAAREYVENFDQKDKVEVWVLDSSGVPIVSSSGFAVTEDDIPDFEAALETEYGECYYTGSNSNHERIMAATHIIKDGDEVIGAVRYIVSMRLAVRSGFIIAIALIFVLVAILMVVLFSGLFFIDSIVKPIKEINTVATRIAEGDLSARVEPRKFDDEISDLSYSINYMAEEINSTDKMKNDFISTVSHEMKTPLTAIKGWAETIQTIGDSDQFLRERGIEVIINESARLTGVVEDLLDLSKIANGRMTLKYEKIDLLAELDETVFMFRDRSAKDEIELVYNSPHFLAPTEGDPNRIDQVFVNVLDNAFKYTNKGGKVTVAAELIAPVNSGDKATLKIYIEDTGVGISKEELPKVKKKFYKSNISVKGSGIGLAICDEIVKMHGGSMDIQSEVGVGTCVILSFPVDYVPVEVADTTIEMRTPIE